MISVIVSLFGVALTTLLTHQQLVDWGWRIPYVFGMLVGPAGLYIRSRIVETPDFVDAEKPETMPISDLLRRHPLPVLLALGVSIISNSSYYLLLYIPTYGVKTLHLPASTGFTATLVGGVILAIGFSLAGHWSDKLRASALMVITCWLFVLTAYPTFWLMAAYPSLAACMFAVGWLQPGQGRLQRRAAVAAVGAVPGRSPRGRRRVQLQHLGDDLRRLRAVRRDLADRRDRRPAVAELLPDGDRPAQPRRVDGDPVAQPPRDPTPSGAPARWQRPEAPSRDRTARTVGRPASKNLGVGDHRPAEDFACRFRARRAQSVDAGRCHHSGDRDRWRSKILCDRLGQTAASKGPSGATT